MPIYIYQSPKGKIKEVVQGMNEKHEYFENGVEWRRVWQIPQASVDTKIDPFSAQDFSNKTANKKGEKLGDLWDRSTECSLAREKIAGRDEIKEKVYSDYSKKTKGKLHPSLIKEKQNRTIIV